MALNKASVQRVGNASKVMVNEKQVHQMANHAKAEQMARRLNLIFQDPYRDLDFITPSVIEDPAHPGKLHYVVACPLVRRGHGITHMHPKGFKPTPMDRNLYEDTYWQDDEDHVKQTAIVQLGSQAAPWHEALLIANRLRDAIKLNFGDAIAKKRPDKTKCYPLHAPESASAAVETVISHAAYCAVYGMPCQGRRPGIRPHVECADMNFPPENILNPFTQYQPTGSEVEIFHPQDLTCAMTDYIRDPRNYWYDRYKNRYIRVTNLANGHSIVVRVTDKAPRNKGVELTYRAWKAIGKPMDERAVKVELMRK